MSTPPTLIVGWPSSWRLPGFAGETVVPAGQLSARDIPLQCLVVGSLLAGGTATAETVNDITSTDDANALFVAGSEVARQCYKALGIQGLKLKAMGLVEPSGAKGTVTVTIGGSWSASGSLGVWIDGEYAELGVASTDSQSDVAQHLGALPKNTWPVTGGNTGNVCTFTRKNKGLRGNDGSCYIDTKALPTGCTALLAGGTALPSKGTYSGVRFTGGSSSDDVTNALAAIFAGTYDRQAWAQADASNADKIRDQMVTKAGPQENRLEQAVFGTNASTSPTSLVQTTLNDVRVQVCWGKNFQSHPSEIAAVMAALRTVTEQDNPVAYYDDVKLPGIVGQLVDSNWPNNTALNTAITGGICALKSDARGDVYVTKSVCTYSLLGAVTDLRADSTYYITMADFFRKDIGLRWLTKIKPANPRVFDDPLSGDPDRPAGVWTPRDASRFLEGILREYEKNTWVVDVSANLPSSGWDDAAKRIVSVAPIKVTPANHQYGVSVRSI